MEFLSWLAWIAAAFAAFMYLGAPLICQHTVRQAAFPSFEAITTEQFAVLADATRAFFPSSSAALDALGFSLAACGRQVRQMSDVTVYLMLFRKDPEQDWAMLAYLVAETKHAREEVSYAEFWTSFADETSIGTSNSSQLPGFDSGPRKRQFWLPHIRDIGRLYTIHLDLVRRFGSAASRRKVRDTQALSMLAEAVQRDFREQEARGWFFLDTAAIQYRLTVTGAYLMTWRLLWPISPIRKICRDLAARRLDASVPR